MKGQLKVYIAGPYTKGGEATNVRNALEAADRVLEAGHVPFVPHLFHFWDFISPKPYEVWMQLDHVMLHACEVVIRLPGESEGSDREVEQAREWNMPVFESVDDFLHEYGEVRK